MARMRMRMPLRHRLALAAGGWVLRRPLARLVMTVAAVLAGIIVLGILLKVLGAHAGNGSVNAVTDASRALAGPFHDLIGLHGAWRYVVNWGIAAALYVALGRVVVRLLLR
jgi:hypothetical protein